MEYTQEQLDTMLAEAKLEARKGLFTQEDLEKQVLSEVDRRVNSGIQKGLETEKKKWEKEYIEKATLTAEELALKKLEEQRNELLGKEKSISVKANLVEAREMLSSAEVPKSHYEKVLDVLVTDDSEKTKVNVENFISVFSETKKEIESKLKSELTKITPPGTGSGESVTKDDFKKMSYADKLKFKASNPETYKEFIK